MTKKHLFRRLLTKVISMALWTKASLCVKSSLLEQSLPRTPNRPKTSAIKNSFLCVLVVINPRNLRNPWLINDLRASKALYNCKETFTDVMKTLQIRLFMQNKANFRKSQMNVSPVNTKDCGKKTLGQHGKNKANQSQSKPIQSQLKPIKCQNKPNFRANIMLNDVLNINRFTTRNGQGNSRPYPLKPD